MRERVGLILFIAAAAVIWWALNLAEHHVNWLRVEAPRRAVAGQPFTLRVHLAPLAEPARLCADLHWGTSRDTPMGCLATGGSKAVGKEGGNFDFEIMVPPREGLRYVHGVIYLSRTGTWDDHTLDAGTELIPVLPGTGAPEKTGLSPLRLQPPNDPSQGHPPPATIPRLLTGLLFLAAAFVAWGAIPSGTGANGVPGHGNRRWQVLALLLALACLWEVLGLEAWLGARARAMARAEDFYYPRAVLQKVVISLATAAAIPFFLFIRRTRSSRRLLLASFALYLAISLVNLVSWHAIDKVADLSWHGLTLVQALKLGCAATVLLGVRNARGSHDS